MDNKQLLYFPVYLFLFSIVHIGLNYGFSAGDRLGYSFFEKPTKIVNKTDFIIFVKSSVAFLAAPVYWKLQGNSELDIKILMHKKNPLNILVYSSQMSRKVQRLEPNIKKYLEDNDLLDIDNAKILIINIMLDENNTILCELDNSSVLTTQQDIESVDLIYETISQLDNPILDLFNKLKNQINQLDKAIFEPLRLNKKEQINFLYRALSGALVYHKIYNNSIYLSVAVAGNKSIMIRNLLYFLFAIALSKNQYFQIGIIALDDPGERLYDFLDLTNDVCDMNVRYFVNYLMSGAGFQLYKSQKTLELENKKIVDFGQLSPNMESQFSRMFIVFTDPIGLTRIDQKDAKYIRMDQVPNDIIERYSTIAQQFSGMGSCLTVENELYKYSLEYMLKKLLDYSRVANMYLKKEIKNLIHDIADKYDYVYRRIGEEVVLSMDNELKGFIKINSSDLEYALEDIDETIIKRV